MQSNSSQHEKRSTSSPPQSISPGCGVTNSKTPSRMQDLPLHLPQQRFTLTPTSMGMDVTVSQPRQQQEHNLESRPDSIPMQQTAAVSIKPHTKQQREQLQATYENMAWYSTNSKDEPVTEFRSSTSASAAASMCKPAGSERRPSSPLSPCGMPSFAPPLSSTAQTAFRSCSKYQETQNLSSPSTPTNERQSTHATHDSAPIQELPTLHFEQQLQKFRSGSSFSTGGAAEINSQLNEIFVKRLNDIDVNGQGDSNLKLVTYQEWVDMLLRINESILLNVEELESEVAKRLEYVQQRMNLNCRHSQGNELMKCRKDIDTLLKLIQNACHDVGLDLHGVTFETITPAQVLGLTDHKFESRNTDAGGASQIRNSSDTECIQKNKLLGNMKALALEVAEKHDEVRELKRQVVCMEDEIQKAQKKIQFKDDVIKELRIDLKRSAKFASAQSVDGCLVMPPINLESESPRSNTATLVSDGNELMIPGDYSYQLESLSQNDHLEQQKLDTLHDELIEFFDIHRERYKQSGDKLKERFPEIFHKLESEKAAAYHQLDVIRRQLIDLENSVVASASAEGATNDCDSGFSSKCGNDKDTKIIDALRKHLRNLNETTCELRSRVEKLENENNELSSNLKSLATTAQRNDQTLKDVADLLCNVTGNPFSYTDIDNKSSQCQMNPFCEAIMNIKSVYQEKEAHLLQVLGHKNQKIEELMQALINKDKAYNEHHRHRLILSEGEDIDNITPPSSLLLQPQQSTLLHQPLQTSLLTRQEKDSLSDEQRQRQH